MKVTLDKDDLVPLVREILGELQAQNEKDQEWLPATRLAFREHEAAAALGIPAHSLRDARLRGEIQASRVGKRLLYRRQDLLDYLHRRREER